MRTYKQAKEDARPRTMSKYTRYYGSC